MAGVAQGQSSGFQVEGRGSIPFARSNLFFPKLETDLTGARAKGLNGNNFTKQNQIIPVLAFQGEAIQLYCGAQFQDAAKDAQMTQSPALEASKPEAKPRPLLISPVEFAKLADLAWRSDPRKGLAKQMSEATGVSEGSCDRWLKDEGHPPPPERIAEALKLANERMYANADLLVKIALILSQNPA